MSGFISSLLSFTENIHENIDPVYKKQKSDAKKEIQTTGLISTIALVASVAIGVLGIALTSVGGLSTLIGIPLILISLPVTYLAFNAYQLSKNMNDFIDAPKEYLKLVDLTLTWDQQKIQKKLCDNTICFEWIVDIALCQILMSKYAQTD